MRLPAKVKPGDPVRASEWNALIDALAARELRVDSTLRLYQTPYGMILGTNRGDGIRWLRCRNDYAGTASAYGVARVTGVNVDNTFAPFLTITRPDTTLTPNFVVLHGSDIAQDGFGFCTLDSPCRILYDSGTPAAGEGWGPKNGQWLISKGHPVGARILGGVVASGTTVWAQWQAIDKLIGKTDAAHAKSASGTISVYAGTQGSESDTTINVTAYNRFAAVATTKWVALAWVNNGWELVAAEC